jgi:hypothetical protein
VTAAHVSGATLGAALGAILAASLHRYHVTAVTDAEAALIGAAMVAVGTGAAHAVWNVGLGPLWARILHGPSPVRGVPVLVPPTVPAQPPPPQSTVGP